MEKLIIVCEENLRQYGDFLSQLVSLSDDKQEEIIGVKDGSVAVQVWTEKEYSANAVKISSEQYLLFIGNSKMIKDKRSHMVVKFSKFGMQYEWLGKQAVLFVDHVVGADEYDSFIDFAKHSQNDVKKLIEFKTNFIQLNTETNSVSEKTKDFKSIANTILANIINSPVCVMNTIDAVNNSKKIKDQEYTCALLVFYLDSLSIFMGLNEGSHE